MKEFLSVKLQTYSVHTATLLLDSSSEIFFGICTENYNLWQKLWEKLLFGQFRVPNPLPLLNKVEKQRAKLVSSYVMASRHCIGAEGDF